MKQAVDLRLSAFEIIIKDWSMAMAMEIVSFRMKNGDFFRQLWGKYDGKTVFIASFPVKHGHFPW